MGKKKGITISKIRGKLYKTAKYLGDIDAVLKGGDKIKKRIINRVLGKQAGKLMGKLWQK